MAQPPTAFPSPTDPLDPPKSAPPNPQVLVHPHSNIGHSGVPLPPNPQIEAVAAAPLHGPLHGPGGAGSSLVPAEIVARPLGPGDQPTPKVYKTLRLYQSAIEFLFTIQFQEAHSKSKSNEKMMNQYCGGIKTDTAWSKIKGKIKVAVGSGDAKFRAGVTKDYEKSQKQVINIHKLMNILKLVDSQIGSTGPKREELDKLMHDFIDYKYTATFNEDTMEELHDEIKKFLDNPANKPAGPPTPAGPPIPAAPNAVPPIKPPSPSNIAIHPANSSPISPLPVPAHSPPPSQPDIVVSLSPSKPPPPSSAAPPASIPPASIPPASPVIPSSPSVSPVIEDEEFFSANEVADEPFDMGDLDDIPMPPPPGNLQTRNMPIADAKTMIYEQLGHIRNYLKDFYGISNIRSTSGLPQDMTVANLNKDFDMIQEAQADILPGMHSDDTLERFMHAAENNKDAFTKQYLSDSCNFTDYEEIRKIESIKQEDHKVEIRRLAKNLAKKTGLENGPMANRDDMVKWVNAARQQIGDNRELQQKLDKIRGMVASLPG